MHENKHFWTNIVFLSIILVLLGAISILISYIVRGSAGEANLTSEILRDFGILLASIGIISTLYETLIRRQLLADYNDMLREIVNPVAQRLGVFALFRDRHDKASSGRLPTNIIALVRHDFLDHMSA